MDDAREFLERAERSAPAPEFGLPDLQRRAARRKRTRRFGAFLVGVIVAGASVLAAYSAIPGAHPVRPVDAGEGLLPPATTASLQAAPGEYYYWKVDLLSGCVAGPCTSGDDRTHLSATYWWATDESGRIQVEAAHNYRIDAGTFKAGDFPNPNGIDVSTFPTDPTQLAPFLLSRSQPDGASPAPMVTPPPDGAPTDGQMWRAITDLLGDPQVTPSVRSALMEVAADLRGSHLNLNGTDPVGRPAYVIALAGPKGEDWTQKLYVDPTTHEFLGWSTSGTDADGTIQSDFVIEGAGVADSIGAQPRVSSIPPPSSPLPAEVRALASSG